MDEHATFIYTDLKKYHGFDLVKYLAGEEYGSVETITALLQTLPDTSYYMAYLSAHSKLNPPADAETDDEEQDPEREAMGDAITWNLDRKMSAWIINLLQMLVKAQVNWEGEPPAFDTWGPSEWSDAKKKAKDEPKQTIEGIMSIFGAV